jgi:hypothetical protein
LISLFRANLGIHRDAAAFLGYSMRHCHNLRQKIERGDSPNPRAESHPRLKGLLLKKTSSRSGVMTGHKKHLGRNAAQLELLAALRKIAALFEAGFDRKTVHGLLRDKGIAAMPYVAFCRQLTRHKDRMTQPKTLGSDLAAEAARTSLLQNVRRETGQASSPTKH